MEFYEASLRRISLSCMLSCRSHGEVSKRTPPHNNALLICSLLPFTFDDHVEPVLLKITLMKAYMQLVILGVRKTNHFFAATQGNYLPRHYSLLHAKDNASILHPYSIYLIPGLAKMNKFVNHEPLEVTLLIVLQL